MRFKGPFIRNRVGNVLINVLFNRFYVSSVNRCAAAINDSWPLVPRSTISEILAADQLSRDCCTS